MSTSHSETTPAEAIVAKVSRTTVVIVAAFAIPAIIAFLNTPSLWRLAIVAIHGMIVYRVAQIRLTVSADGVLVRNFFSDTLIPLWEADVELAEMPGGKFLLSDSGGKYDTGGRILYVNQPWNQTRIHVGAAPRFGSEVDRIHIDLTDAINLQRAA